MVKVRLYVEGGGDSRALHAECRRGFRKLLEKAGFQGRMPAITACGGRNAAFDDFRAAVQAAVGHDCPMLLVDSEAPVTGRCRSAWDHLHRQDGWERPARADDDQAQLMVQCMETWCVADRGALRRVFGACLQESALPALKDLEQRAKDDIQQALEHATRECGHGRSYSKGRRSFQVVAELNPNELKARLPHFAELCSALSKRLSPAGG